MDLVQTVAPTSEPLSLDDAKAFMRVLETDDDAIITDMIVSAREYAEDYTNRQFKSATYELKTECLYSGLTIPKSPVTSISSIEYMDENEVYQTLSTDDYYTYREFGATKIHIVNMPTYKDDKRAIKITFVAGYASVPSSIVSYIKILVSTLYENRELYVVGASVDKLANPMAIKMLDKYKVQSV